MQSFNLLWWWQGEWDLLRWRNLREDSIWGTAPCLWEMPIPSSKRAFITAHSTSPGWSCSGSSTGWEALICSPSASYCSGRGGTEHMWGSAIQQPPLPELAQPAWRHWSQEVPVTPRRKTMQAAAKAFCKHLQARKRDSLGHKQLNTLLLSQAGTGREQWQVLVRTERFLSVSWDSGALRSVILRPLTDWNVLRLSEEVLLVWWRWCVSKMHVKWAIPTIIIW